MPSLLFSGKHKRFSNYLINLGSYHGGLQRLITDNGRFYRTANFGQRPILDNGRKKEGHRPLYATPEFLTYHYYYFYQGHPFVGFPSFVPQCYRIEFSIAPILIMTFFVI